MTDRRRFILSEIGIFFLTYLIDFLYILIMVNIAPVDRKYWKNSHYTAGWILLSVFICIYLYILIKYLRHRKSITLGSIYSIITQMTNITRHISTLTFPYDEWKWNGFYIIVLLFSFIGLPILFIIIAIVYFKRKKSKHKSGE